MSKSSPTRNSNVILLNLRLHSIVKSFDQPIQFPFATPAPHAVLNIKCIQKATLIQANSTSNQAKYNNNNK